MHASTLFLRTTARKNFVRAGVGRPGGAGSCGRASLAEGGLIYAASSPALAHDGGAAAAACSTCARTRLSAWGIQLTYGIQLETQAVHDAAYPPRALSKQF